MNLIKRHKPETKYTDDTLLEIFKKLKTIEDIIRLENLGNRELNVYMTNPVFVRLYDTIPALKELNAMIGITEIKQNIMKNIIHLAIDGTIKCNLCHTKIFGPPGVGKTHFAKILGKVYHTMGFLETDNFVPVKQDDLQGKYVGHTAPKTRKLIDRCRGGVMFIDEVYSLAGKDKPTSFATEAIDVLTPELSSDTCDFICIIAGYEDEVKERFFTANRGLESRFPIEYVITGYTSEEMAKMYIKMVDDSNNSTDNTIWEVFVSMQELTEFFARHKKKFPAYGRDINKFVHACKVTASSRLIKIKMIPGEPKLIILNDIINTIDTFGQNVNFVANMMFS